MPGKNTIKEYAAEQYYHIYSRGVAKQTVFHDQQDYGFFLGLFKRYLSSNPEKSKRHGEYPHFGDSIDLLAFCLMPNHFHLLIYQYDQKAMVEFMRSLMTSYSLYYNRRYKRSGPVFEGRYKASLIDKSSYLEHISRYIHLNPNDWQKYSYSSLSYYIGKRSAEWVKPDDILDIFDHDVKEYLTFLGDYEDQKKMIDELKWELANSAED